MGRHKRTVAVVFHDAWRTGGENYKSEVQPGHYAPDARLINNHGQSGYIVMRTRRKHMKKYGILFALLGCTCVHSSGAADPYPEHPVRLARQAENLNRGVVAVRKSSSQVYVGWRMLGTDPTDVAFNLYRSSNGGTPVKLNSTPLTQTTDYLDSPGSFSASLSYFVRPVINGSELSDSETFTLPASPPIRQFLEVPLQVPNGGTTPDAVDYTYSANDCSVGDLDGDGALEIVLKWDPSNSKDNSQSGYTGNVYLDAYELDGTRLWRIDLGVNIRAGAHYTQFQVYDLDGDGKAEVACRTAPGTKDGLGNDVILSSDDPLADYRETSGYILTGPEYLTVFDGSTGAELATTDFTPDRINVSQWGDNYGNRCDRFLAGIAYLDGRRPSLIMARGYYGPRSGYSARNEITAWNWRNGQLTREWWFQAGLGINGNINSDYIGQGNHQLSIADVDGDGYDEIIYGACCIDQDGTGLYTTGLGHGDALHVSDMDPSNPGLEVFMPHEDPGSYGIAGGELRDAMTGDLLFSIPANNDVGRGCAMDIDPNHPGYEFWATTSDPDGGVRKIFNVQDGPLYDTPANMFYNFGVWWDADLTRELLDGTTISEWNNPGRSNFDLDPATGGTQSYAPGCSSNNGTKSTPALSGDILGDWREEVIWRTSDSSALRIFTTIIKANNRMPTLLHDIQYREAIAWQNTAYNQPPHPSFFLGAGMDPAPPPSIYLAGVNPTTPFKLSISNNVISFASTPFGFCSVESKTSLTNDWQLYTNIVATGTNTQVVLPMTGESMFYRAGLE